MTSYVLGTLFILASLVYLWLISFSVSEWLARREMKLYKEDAAENYKRMLNK